MGILGFQKKAAEGNAEPKCACTGNTEVFEAPGCCCGSRSGNDKRITSIKVLGLGCKSCHEQYENAKKAAEELRLGVEIEYITNLATVTSYGVMSMPAIVVNETVVSMGKVLKSADVIRLLGKLGY